MGSRDVVTVVESKIMYKIIKGLKVSLPMLMVEHMEQASGTRVNLTLPYAPWLTKVFVHCGVSLEHEKVEEPAGLIGKDLLRRMHVDLERAQARFQVEWERRSKHRSEGGAPEAGGEVRVSTSSSEDTSTDDNVDAFVRLDREAPPQGEGARVVEVGESSRPPPVQSPPRGDPWNPQPPPSPTPVPPTVPSSSTSLSQTDSALILKEIRHLTRGIRSLHSRFDVFESVVHNRFDHIEEELHALRRQAYHPPSPVPTHASYRPERDRAASSGSNYIRLLDIPEPVNVSSSSHIGYHSPHSPPLYASSRPCTLFRSVALPHPPHLPCSFPPL